MPLLTSVRSFLRNVFRRRRVDGELDAELRAHVDLLAEENMRAGMTRDEWTELQEHLGVYSAYMQLADIDAVIGREIENADAHIDFLSASGWSRLGWHS